MQKNSPANFAASSDNQESIGAAAAVQPNDGMRAVRAHDGWVCGEGAKGSSPTNREPYNSNNEYFKLLRFGVDSLYLSYQGDLFPEVQERLTKLKQLAQHPEIDQQALAQYPIAGHIFEVKDKGSSVFPFVLEDGAFRIQLSRASKKLPMDDSTIDMWLKTSLAEICPAEVDLLESILPEIIKAMMQVEELQDNA